MLLSTSVTHGEFFQPRHTWFAWALPHMSEGPRRCASLLWPAFRGFHGPVHLATLETFHTALPILHLWLFFFLLSLPPAPLCCAVSRSHFQVVWIWGWGAAVGVTVPCLYRMSRAPSPCWRSTRFWNKLWRTTRRQCTSSPRPAGPWWPIAILKGACRFINMRLTWQFLLVRASCVSLWEAFLKQTQ